jgi:DNA-binding transcriptional MerR regulator
MTSVGERGYRSIGEVLAEVQDEFPDITISKIRFLESQGLIDPERTASGYRKFYDNDVARLRAILRTQREEYLPLKVIRDRLDRDDRADLASEAVGAESTRSAFGATRAGYASIAQSALGLPSHDPSRSRSVAGDRSRTLGRGMRFATGACGNG